MISEQYNSIFVHINKTAGQSIERALGWQKHPESDHRTAHQYKEKLGHKFEKMFVFSVVRNPYDKMVSMYHGRKQLLGSKRPQNINFTEWVKKVNTTNPLHPAIIKGTTNQLGWIASPRWKWDETTKRYKNKPSEVNLLVDYIIRFENLQDDWKEVCSQIGVSLTLPHINQSTHKPYKTYYDQETKKIVQQRFERDLNYFGYTF